MSIGQVQATISYMWLALQPAIRLSQVAGQMVETMVSVRRIFELLDIPVTVTSPPDAPAIRTPRGEIRLSQVSFAYTDDEPLFQGLDMHIESGKTIALVGHTGCGKTTLTSLLMRFWDVHRGTITIDGTDIRSVDVSSLRRLFGVVPQHPVVFEETIHDNIAYGKKYATRDEVVGAAKRAEIHETIMRLPHGYDTLLGTRGIRLSLGEKQRISIARAIIKQPRILVLDEATSALDSESEEAIQRALEVILRHRTSLVIAHRLSTIVNADRIIVMRHGRIVETGTHRELRAIPNGEYRRYYTEMLARQTGDI
jgi:ABC-type multidrug transport system fused ATPase/permease subunit